MSCTALAISPSPPHCSMGIFRHNPRSSWAARHHNLKSKVTIPTPSPNQKATKAEQAFLFKSPHCTLLRRDTA